jgi:tetratricopeptide (TPR) repeat protein
MRTEDAAALNEKGVALLKQRRFEEALRLFKEALALNLYNREAWFNKALAEDQMGLVDRALGSYKRFIQLVAPQESKQVDFARKRINELTAGRTEQPPARPPSPVPAQTGRPPAEEWTQKGVALFKENRLQDALACFEKALDLAPRSIRPLFNKAIVLGDLRRDEEALACYGRVLEIDPKVSDAWLNKGAILKTFGRLEEALSCFEKALQIDPGIGLAWFNRGKTLADLGRFQEAIGSYGRALKINPRDVNSMNNKGTCLQEMGQFSEALVWYEKLLAIDPKHAFAWNNRGEVLNRLVRFKEAIPCFDRALQIKTFASPWHGKGESLRNLGLHREAMGCYGKAIEIYRDFGQAWYGKALSEDSLGLKDQAIDSYKRFLALSPKAAEKEIGRARQRLSELGIAVTEVPPSAPQPTAARRKALPQGSGEFIGQKYEVYRVLGKGGFGVVYQVYSHETDTVYALKTFRDEYVQDEQTRTLFRKEAQTLVDMGSHPYLVRDYFVEEISGRLYIAMEYVAPDEEGLNSLEAYLQRRPPDLGQSLRWAIQFCHGMEFACSRGLRCHRDIKPANILIDQQKRVKISDFGLAGLLDSHQPRSGLNPAVRISGGGMVTARGASFGTPTHMPSEQFVDAASCDERSDIYSFGIVLYQMISRGSLPFLTASPPNDSSEEWNRFWKAMHELHLKAPVPRIPSPLFPVIERCLKKARAERYASFRDLRSDLEPLLANLNGEKVMPPSAQEMNAAEWLNKGLSLKNLGRIEDALDCYNKAIEMRPRPETAALLWSNKGACYHVRGRFDEAIGCFDQALQLDPKSAKAWCNKGFSLDQLGRYAEALRCLDKALEAEPHLSLAWSNKAFTYLGLKDFEQAVLSADMAIRNDPKNEAAWVNKGAALYGQKKLKEAMA